MDSVIEWKNRIWTTSVQSTQIISMRSSEHNKNAQPWSRRSCQLCFGCTNRCMITSHLLNFLVHLHIQSATTPRPRFTAVHLTLIEKKQKNYSASFPIQGSQENDLRSEVPCYRDSVIFALLPSWKRKKNKKIRLMREQLFIAAIMQVITKTNWFSGCSTTWDVTING